MHRAYRSYRSPLLLLAAIVVVAVPTAWYSGAFQQGSLSEARTFVFHPEGTPGILDGRHFSELLSEKQVVQIFESILQGQRDQVVVDAGMNSGYFTMLAASLGAKVLSFDLQVYCIKIVTQLLKEKNQHLLPNIEIVNLGLGTPAIVSVPNNTCEGEFGQNGVPKAGSVEGAGSKVSVSIVDPKHILQTWSRQVNLVKIDTEGAEADILTHLLPLVEAGRIQHIVAELMPSQWANRGSSLEAGLATMKKLATLSKRMVLLFDPAGFTFPREQISLSGVIGALFEKFNIEDLVKDRKNGGGCNVWWTF